MCVSLLQLIQRLIPARPPGPSIQSYVLYCLPHYIYCCPLIESSQKMYYDQAKATADQSGPEQGAGPV